MLPYSLLTPSKSSPPSKEGAQKRDDGSHVSAVQCLTSNHDPALGFRNFWSSSLCPEGNDGRFYDASFRNMLATKAP